MNPSGFDVAVCGAGPAGSAAALVLARAGRRVVVIERAAHPRDKICGDLLGTDAVHALERLGIASVAARGFALGGAFLHSPRGREFGGSVASARRAVVVPRRALDADLAAAARTAGATFLRARVTGLRRDERGRVEGVTTSTGPIEARVTIGADGYGSVVARGLGVAAPASPSIALAARAYATGVSDLARSMHFLIGVPSDGYAWIFPLGDGRANVGLGYIRSELEAARRSVPPWAEAFAELRASLVGARFLARATLEATHAWPIPLYRRMRRGFPGALLAGDAAGLASPLSGSGIASALTTGAAAARFAERSLAGDVGAERAYERWVLWHLGLRTTVEGYAHRAFATPARVDRALAPIYGRGAANATLAGALLALG